MRKITITKDELKVHKKYFQQNITTKLEKAVKGNSDNKKYSRRQIDFLSLCLYYEEQLAIGEPEQLREIQGIIDKKYTGIYNDLKFKEDVKKIFDYDKFSRQDIGENIINIAKEEAEKGNHTEYNRYGHDRILDKIKEQLSKYDKNMTEEFSKRVTSMKNIKKTDLIEIIGELLIKKVKNGNLFWNDGIEWNPYMLQYNRNLRTCPYCNRQYITPYYSKSGKVRADLDHFWPKSEFPHFSMSIYNLVPCCKFCNSSLKGVNEFGVKDLSPYEISIDDYAIFRYQPGFYREIKFEAEDPVCIYKEIFKIEELYNYHVNIAEELHSKYKEYPEFKIKDMMDSGFFESEKNIYEMILGRISRKDEILDEPLNKFKRDIVKEIYGEQVLEYVTGEKIKGDDS